MANISISPVVVLITCSYILELWEGVWLDVSSLVVRNMNLFKLTLAVQTQVDHVVGKMTLNHFALKKISRTGFFKDDEEGISLFANELDILKSLSHRHIVKLVGSYTDRDCIGILMLPVADMNLAQFLRKGLSSQDREDRNIKLRSFFGCIATAIDYLHRNEKKKVRHKDIKPENILVKDYSVFIADFGTSHAWAGENVSGMTEGTQKFFTPKYIAPEARYGVSERHSHLCLSCGKLTNTG